MSDATKAVFLSYARDDAAAARRIAEALRSSGLEVWFDENELRGGDAWDAKIRTQIKTCTLFLAIISAHTQSRLEGYFRLEWKLAVERTHLMMEGAPFLVPIVIDDTREDAGMVPEQFMRVQWTRLAGALPTTQFVEQVERLLCAPRGAAADVGRGRRPRREHEGASDGGVSDPALQSNKRPSFNWIVASLGVAVLALVALIFLRPGAKEPVAAANGPAAESVVNAKSIAVLPFANLSADKDNEFFADGMHDDLITALAKVRDLKVISRTSVMPYKTGERNLKKIAASSASRPCWRAACSGRATGFGSTSNSSTPAPTPISGRKPTTRT